MNGLDSGATRTATLGVGLVAITAAVISFSHVRAVALHAGESDLTAWLLPVSIDGAVVAAVSVLLADSRAGCRPATLTWMLLALGLGASLAANVASAEPTLTARAVAAWPPIALALGIEVLANVSRRRFEVAGTSAGPPSRATRFDTEVPDGSLNRSEQSNRPAVGRSGIVPAPINGSNGRAAGANGVPSLDDGSAVTLIRQLDEASPAGRVSRLEIQRMLGCGGSRAARLADLARSALDAPPLA